MASPPPFQPTLSPKSRRRIARILNEAAEDLFKSISGMVVPKDAEAKPFCAGYAACTRDIRLRAAEILEEG